LVDSQKAFKTRFLTEKEKFDPVNHEIVTFDIKAMYPNINLNRTIDYIIATIFRAPKNYLKPEKDKHGYTGCNTPFPSRPKKNLRPFFKEFYVITIFSNAKLAHINNFEASKWVAL
jgi:hypothetical protein